MALLCHSLALESPGSFPFCSGRAIRKHVLLVPSKATRIGYITNLDLSPNKTSKLSDLWLSLYRMTSPLTNPLKWQDILFSLVQVSPLWGLNIKWQCLSMYRRNYLFSSSKWKDKCRSPLYWNCLNTYLKIIIQLLLRL